LSILISHFHSCILFRDILNETGEYKVSRKKPIYFHELLEDVDFVIRKVDNETHRHFMPKKEKQQGQTSTSTGAAGGMTENDKKLCLNYAKKHPTVGDH
jgi:hypothetical protein